VALLLANLACTSAAPPPPVREPVRREPVPLDIAQADRSYLIDPLEGYSLEIDMDRRAEVQNAWRELLQAGDVDLATETSEALLNEDPEFHPARVLAGQIDFAAGLDEAVIERLLPVSDAFPSYTASQMLVGRSAEKLGDVPLAYAAYRAVATRNPLALKRTGELHPRALEILSSRLQDALREGQVDEAEKHLALLNSWAPSETLTFEGARAVAVSRGDRVAELAAVKELSSRRPEDLRLLERRGALEMEVGDPSAALQIVQELADQNPRDPKLAEMLEAAKFRWRLSQLPRGVQEVAARPELDRAGFAVLLYWLVPDVRNTRASAGRIATDVLDHPHQEEIVRVVNLGLMDVDATLHRFSPGAAMRRNAAVRSLTRLLSRFGGAACLSGAQGQGDTCEVALRCGLLPAGEDCQLSAPVSGGDGVELIRRALEQLGGS
jgi:tetratricopeptide (TPR) repeat protein